LVLADKPVAIWLHLSSLANVPNVISSSLRLLATAATQRSDMPTRGNLVAKLTLHASKIFDGLDIEPAAADALETRPLAKSLRELAMGLSTVGTKATDKGWNSDWWYQASSGGALGVDDGTSSLPKMVHKCLVSLKRPGECLKVLRSLAPCLDWTKGPEGVNANIGDNAGENKGDLAMQRIHSYAVCFAGPGSRASFYRLEDRVVGALVFPVGFTTAAPLVFPAGVAYAVLTGAIEVARGEKSSTEPKFGNTDACEVHNVGRGGEPGSFCVLPGGQPHLLRTEGGAPAVVLFGTSRCDYASLRHILASLLP
jgi:hypothetical protein